MWGERVAVRKDGDVGLQLGGIFGFLDAEFDASMI
jgi:hypothetical protein